MLTKLLLIILQYIHISNYVVYLTLIQCYMLILSQFKKNKDTWMDRTKKLFCVIISQDIPKKK